MDLEEGPRADPVERLAPEPPFLDQAGVQKNPQVLGKGGLGHVESLRQPGDGPRPVQKEVQDRSPCRIGYRSENVMRLMPGFVSPHAVSHSHKQMLMLPKKGHYGTMRLY